MKKLSFPLLLIALFTNGFAAAADNTDALMKSMRKEGSPISNTDKDLFSSSVRASKSSIAHDMLDTFYADAVDLQRDRRYDEALELYERVLTVDPTYKDVQARRETILKQRSDAQHSVVRRSAQDLIRQGDVSLSKGLSLQAIGYWKQALEKDPTNTVAQKKITDVNKSMARRQFEEGYIHYKHNEMEDALDSWQNAIAFDPTLKNRGLLLLMSKVELNLRREQQTRLSNQGYDQYQAGDLNAALLSYEELLKIDPRHDEARRMTAKIKIQLGQAAFKSAQNAAARKAYSQALQQYQLSLNYGWEPVKSQAGVQDMKQKVERARLPEPPPPSKTKKPSKEALPPPDEGPLQAPPPAVAVDPRGAKEHYRQGLAAVRSKDYQRAVQELELAQQLDATDERIYMALQRAKQEWREAAGTGP